MYVGGEMGEYFMIGAGDSWQGYKKITSHEMQHE